MIFIDDLQSKFTISVFLLSSSIALKTIVKYPLVLRMLLCYIIPRGNTKGRCEMTLQPIAVEQGLAIPAKDIETLADGFFSKYQGATLRTYQYGIRSFCDFLGIPREDTIGASRLLFASGAGNANALAQSFMDWLRDRGRAPKTCNGYLAAIKALAKYARLIGLIAWGIEIKSVRADTYRDTRGPGIEGIRDIIAILEADTSPKGIRDYAVMRLFWGLGLRRGAVVKLDVADIDLKGGAIHVQEKGREGKERRTLPAKTLAALSAWMDVRSSTPNATDDGPLFVSFDRAAAVKGGENNFRITPRCMTVLIGSLGDRANVGGLTPHKIRHAAITHALNRTGGDVRKVQRFSGHRDIRVLQVYDDNRVDFAGEIAALVDGDI